MSRSRLVVLDMKPFTASVEYFSIIGYPPSHNVGFYVTVLKVNSIFMIRHIDYLLSIDGVALYRRPVLNDNCFTVIVRKISYVEFQYCFGVCFR